MKKNKRKNYKKEMGLDKLFKEYRIKFFASFVGMFILLSLVVTVSSYLLFRNSYLNTSKKTINEYLMKIEAGFNRPFENVFLLI